jgi:hypothetical protein
VAVHVKADREAQFLNYSKITVISPSSPFMAEVELGFTLNVNVKDVPENTSGEDSVKVVVFVIELSITVPEKATSLSYAMN